MATQATVRIANKEVLTLENMFGRTSDELRAIYYNAMEPTSIEGLYGDPHGRGLAPHLFSSGPLSFIGSYVSRKSAEPDFVWAGKSFRPKDARTGTGFNRLRLWGIQDAFPFNVAIAKSLYDGRKTITLDFDVPENPSWEKPTWDELREVSPGIYMGPTSLRRPSGIMLMAWFGVDCNNQVKTAFQK